MKLIPLTQGLFAQVDDDMFEELNKHKWHALKTKNGNFYAARSGPKPVRGYIYMHRVVTGALLGEEADHRDGNGLNNTSRNLQVVSHADNGRGFCRKRPGASSEFRGVYWDKCNCKWRAGIRHDGHAYSLGRFTDEVEAARAFDRKARELGWPEEGLNFPRT